MLLSILITSIPQRQHSLQCLLNELDKQIINNEEVEICCIIDNKTHTIGEKRNALLNLVHGQFFTFIDDDDMISNDYIKQILNVIKHKPDIDIITFKQGCYQQQQQEPCFVIDADMSYGTNEPIPMNGPWKPLYKRLAWHWCVFNTVNFIDIKFPQLSMYEDQLWLQNIYKRIKTQHKIDAILYKYTFLGKDAQTQELITQKNL
jgi:glycosyltransferase involved in cell wall biosynthesis